MCQNKNKCSCEKEMPIDFATALLMLAIFMPFGGPTKPTTTINIYTDKSVEVKNG